MTRKAPFEEVDILVAGGGVAGLAATALFATERFRTICVDASPPPPTDARQQGADLRTTAFLQPSIETLKRAGAWAGVAEQAADLRIMRLIDAGGPEPVARETADFDSSEVQNAPFGANAPNTAIRQALMNRTAELTSAELRAPAGVTRLTARDDGVIVALADGAMVRAKLVIGADGRDSAIRRMSGVEAKRWGYGQKGLVFAVRHPRPHQGVSTEIHRTGGPFTLVPMPDDGDGPRSSVVWMTPGPRALRLMELDETAFAEEATAASLGVLGPLTLASRRAVWPIISQIAERLDAPRVALIAEAAHVVPPIGAQGLNMSLKDIDTLATLCVEARAKGEDIGAPALLARYHRARWPDTAAHVAGIDALNRAAMAENQSLRDLRRAGLKTIHDVKPLRRIAMRAGLGAH